MTDDTIKIGEIPPERFGVLKKYLDDPNITDIDYNGSDLWVRNIHSVRKKVDEPEVTPEWIDTFTQRIADVVSLPFNKMNDVLEAQSDTLRITCVHESAAMTGKAICIRKTSTKPRINYEDALHNGYGSQEVIDLLINCMYGKMNLVIAGMPGVGKTELAKFLCQFIPDDEKVITIEDTPEWHYKEFKPNADCIELRTTDKFTYTKALKTCMRLNPSRVMLSEVRSVEAAHLIECWTAGVKGITTIHTDDVRKIPDRILNMMPTVDAERLENNVYDSLDVGILLRTRILDNGDKQRYIDQVSFFSRTGESRMDKKNTVIPIVVNGELITHNIPEDKLKKLRDVEIYTPFECAFVKE